MYQKLHMIYRSKTDLYHNKKTTMIYNNLETNRKEHMKYCSVILLLL